MNPYSREPGSSRGTATKASVRRLILRRGCGPHSLQRAARPNTASVETLHWLAM